MMPDLPDFVTVDQLAEEIGALRAENVLLQAENDRLQEENERLQAEAERPKPAKRTTPAK